MCGRVVADRAGKVTKSTNQALLAGNDLGSVLVRSLIALTSMPANSGASSNPPDKNAVLRALTRSVNTPPNAAAIIRGVPVAYLHGGDVHRSPGVNVEHAVDLVCVDDGCIRTGAGNCNNRTAAGRRRQVQIAAGFVIASRG